MKQFFTSLFLASFIISSFAQVDIGISAIRVAEPMALTEGDTIFLGDTIGQLQIDVHNYSSQSISGTDFPPDGEYQYQISYNGTTKMYAALLVGSIDAGTTRLENMPENFPPTSGPTLPKFPSGTGPLEICASTNFSFDADPSNDEKCITLNIVDPADTVGSNDPATVGKIDARQSFNIYNSNRRLNLVSSSNIRNAQLQVYSLDGKAVIRESLSLGAKGNHSVNTGQLKPGYYLVEISKGTDRLHLEKLYIK